jgi:hypothetical protein
LPETNNAGFGDRCAGSVGAFFTSEETVDGNELRTASENMSRDWNTSKGRWERRD